MINNSSNKGFTLIELLIVVAVIGILASIVVVSLSDQTDTAQDSSTKLSVSSLRTPALAEQLKNPTGANLCKELYKKVSSDNKATTWGSGTGICTKATNVDATTGTTADNKIGTICCASIGNKWAVFGRLSTHNGTTANGKDFHCADSANNFSIVDNADIVLTGVGTAPKCK